MSDDCDVDTHTFVEDGTGGCLYLINERHTKLNNPDVEAYDPSLPEYSHILRCKWLYSCAIMQSETYSYIHCILWI